MTQLLFFSNSILYIIRIEEELDQDFEKNLGAPIGLNFPFTFDPQLKTRLWRVLKNPYLSGAVVSVTIKGD